MKTSLIAVLALIPMLALAGDPPPANSKLVVDESFDEANGKQWHINFGDWTPVDGVLRAKQIKADNHGAAARRTVKTKDGDYEVRFRFTGEGKAFHMGFDPGKGELDKKGHLYSVIVMPGSWKIMKHVDKAKPKEDPNEVLAEATTTFEKGQWYTLRITQRTTSVTAKIDGKEPLKASHPTFGVSKPTVVFRCIGDGIEMDDLKVWTPKS